MTSTKLTLTLCAALLAQGAFMPGPRAQTAAPTELQALELPPEGGELVSPLPSRIPEEMAGAELAGADVIDPKGREIGRITDIVYTDDGTIAAAVITTSGFLGFGRHRAAVPVEQMAVIDPADDQSRPRILVPLSKADLRALPDVSGDHATATQ